MDNKNLDNNFDIEGHFSYFLDNFFLSGPKGDTISPYTKNIIEKSFYAGMFHYYFIMEDIFSLEEKSKQISVFDKVKKQILNKLNIKEKIIDPENKPISNRKKNG